MDPTFNPVITNDSDAFREKAVQAMEKERQGKHLDESFKLLSQNHSLSGLSVLQRKTAVLSERSKDSFSANYQKEAERERPLAVGNSLVDAFTLQYYEGFPLDQVAWGEIKRISSGNCCRS